MKIYRLKQEKGGMNANDEVVIILTNETQIRIQRIAEYKSNSAFFKAFVQVEEQDAFLEYVRDEDLGEKEVVQSVAVISNVRSNNNNVNEVKTKEDCGRKTIEFNVLAVFTTDCVVLPETWKAVPELDLPVIDPDLLVARIETAIDDMNVAFRNSQIDVQAKLVKIEGNDPYMDNGQEAPVKITDYKAELLKGDQGQFKRVFDLRAEKDADVILFVAGANAGPSPEGGAKPARTKYEAFVVIRFEDLLPEFTTAHEIAHLFGADHEAGGKTGLHTQVIKEGAYAHGYVTPEWRTIMAYAQDEEGNPPVIQHYSNPDVLYHGVPTGTAQANNARQIRGYAPTLVALRNT